MGLHRVRSFAQQWFVVLGLLLCAAAPARAQLLSPGPLSRAHKELEGDAKCQQCHASRAQVVESLCVDCHRDIGAQRQNRSGLHGKAFKDKSCASCHVEHLGANVSLIRWPGPDKNKFDHSQTGWPLTGAHAKAECADCHDKKNVRGAPTYLGLEKRCTSCHKDPHENRFGSRCTDCHSDRSWKDGLNLNNFNHDLARFPLEGAHKKVECVECHGRPPQYRNLEFKTCNSCHEDPHRGQFKQTCKTCHAVDSWQHIVMPRSIHPGLSLAAGHARTECTSCHDQGLLAAPSKGSECVSCHAPVHEAPFGNKCEQCHASIKWLDLPVNIGRAAHVRTAFPLRGEHGRVPCASCHRPSLPQAARYRSLSYNKCAACHKDVHEGTLKEYGDCGLCHDPIGFAPSLVEAPLHAKFGFTLDGSHEATACSGCHKFPANTRRTVWELENDRCENCHKNPHGTEFALEMADGGCAHCHGTQGWGLPNIDHSFWPLTGAHAGAACSACHTPTEADKKTGRGASYRGVPRACEGCHDDVHAGQFRISEPVRDCSYCHMTLQFTLPFFDHQKITSYPLEGKHAELECSSCHPGTTLRNGEEVVRYRLGYNQCADCHADPHSPPKGGR